jgi:hypothetical protein
MEAPQTLKLELTYDPAIPLLGTYPKESKSTYTRDTCTPMLIAALFTIASYGISLGAIYRDEWMKKI